MNVALVTLLRKLISDSNIHTGFRVFVAMVITFIPFLLEMTFPLFDQSTLNISISLCLGVMGRAIVENDDNHKGRRKYMLAILACFFTAAASVEILMPYPIIFALGLLSSSFIFMMLGALSPYYSRVGFGSILVSTYTMLGYEHGIGWYEPATFINNRGILVQYFFYYLELLQSKPLLKRTTCTVILCFKPLQTSKIGSV
ncbi:FUSC family membrane protein [Psychromonas sp. KJ10-10]|uniref:FUSC family membrane protein n=1 Tax=Psychromonas sp. KJ10-10 TaxID=3391823 RepID=UPI0039B5914C